VHEFALAALLPYADGAPEALAERRIDAAP
jgi:hypothetical protein